jgi:hypothetical protein
MNKYNPTNLDMKFQFNPSEQTLKKLAGEYTYQLSETSRFSTEKGGVGFVLDPKNH